MSYIHLMLEAYCGYEHRKNKKIGVPEFCKNGVNEPGYHCFENECQFKSYTKCPNQISYVELP